MRPYLLALILIHFIIVVTTEPCNPTGISCINRNQYQLCINKEGNALLIGNVITCPDEKVCNDITYFPCVTKSAEDPTTTTTVAPVTPPNCIEYGKHPADLCNQYYECNQFLWWWNTDLKTCPSGQAFDVTIRDCTEAEALICKLS